MRKHTKGPWKLELDASVVMGGQVVITRDNLAPDGASAKEREANARLIAAAPEMLEAAKELIAAICYVYPANSRFWDSKTGQEFLKGLNPLERAIAKAEGRE